MLKDSFYTVCSTEPVETGGPEQVLKNRFRIALNSGHSLFNGHFPGNPVVPGVVQLEMIRELAGTMLECDLMLVSSDTIKYLQMIAPNENPEIIIELVCRQQDGHRWDVSASIACGETICLKFRGIFQNGGA